MTPTTQEITSWLIMVISGLTALTAIFAVLSHNILRSIVYLMGSLFLTAGLYLFLNAEFLAGIQVLVYVGGIVVLLVFAVMMTRSNELLEDRPSALRKSIGAPVALGTLALFWAAIYMTDMPSSTLPLPEINDVAAIGHALLDFGGSGYVLPFELISLLLLATLIGGVVIARNVPKSKGEPHA